MRCNTDWWIVKLDAIGTLNWQKCYGGYSGERPQSIKQTDDGGYIIAGGTTSTTGDVIGNHGWRDAWIIKLKAPNPLNILELEKQPLIVYPNPSTGIIHCNYPYKVYTLQGQEVNGQLQSGVYLLVTEVGAERLVIH